MSDPLLDDLARTLARPMPRRRAVRVMAAGFLAASIPALRPRLAAAGSCSPPPTPCGSFCCPPDKCCTGNNTCCSGEEVCCNGAPGSGDACCPSGWTCCNPDTPNNHCCPPEKQCIDTGCVAPCPDGRPRCNDACCDKDEDCVGGKCVVKCPPKRTRCGDECCPKGERCVKGKCRECEEGHKACGRKCCDKGEECYWVDSNPDRKICCDCGKGGTRACCPVGPPDQDTATCCPRGDECAKQINQGEGGVTSDSPTVCCPKKRFVPGPDVCCPPGYRSMGGKLVVTPCPGDPTSDLCCEEGLTCSSGKDITCCCPGQSCVEGRCV